MEALLNQIKQDLEGYEAWQKATRVVIGVSGGVDSMVLMTCLSQIITMKDHRDKELIVAHFDHRLRPESGLDADLVKSYAENLGLLYFAGSWQAPANKNIESEARQARYTFMADVMEATESQVLITAHHANDLAETIILRMIRGTSLKGLSAIRPEYERILQTSSGMGVVTHLLRPLLNISKKEIYHYAHTHQIPFREDESNQDMQYLRNRIRHNILPLLEQENPQLLATLARSSGQIEASYQTHFQNYMAEEADLLMFAPPNHWILYRPAFAAMDPAKREVYLTIFLEERLVWTLPSYNKDLINQLDAMIMNQTSPNMTIDIADGWKAVKQYDMISIQPFSLEDDGNRADLSQGRQELFLTEINKWYQINRRERMGIFRSFQVSHAVTSQAALVIPLNLDFGQAVFYHLRHRQDGDVIQLKTGQDNVFHKKISRIMIDDKLPQHQRDSRWLLCDRDNQIMAYLPDYVAVHPQITSSDQASHLFIYQNIEH